MRKFGIISLSLGLALLLAALGLLGYNIWQSQSADAASAEVLAELQPQGPQSLGNAVMQTEHVDAFDEAAQEAYAEMKVVEFDGYGYIGYLSIPAIDKVLPVMDTWDYDRLKIAPCRQFGAARSRDLVIAAHNFETHFGKISKLAPGDAVTFTDMDNTVFVYEVAYVDLLRPTDVDKVQNSDFDLVLYTCTYGGENRVTVFCNLAEV